MPMQPIRQAAALPVRDGKLCMVTSRSRSRWVFPKGRIEVRQTAAEAAMTEAWEEAGVLGVIQPEPVGAYHYEKAKSDHFVTVFILQVVNVREEWPESTQRKREWVTVEEAIKRVEEPELQEIIRKQFLSDAPKATSA